MHFKAKSWYFCLALIKFKNNLLHDSQTWITDSYSTDKNISKIIILSLVLKNNIGQYYQ